ALVAFGFFVTTLMLYRQGGILRDVSKQVMETSQHTVVLSNQLAEVAAMARDSHAVLQETRALTAQATAALDSATRHLENVTALLANVTRLVVHPGGRTP